MSAVIELNQVSVRFRMLTIDENSLKQTVAAWLNRDKRHTFTALNRVSLTIQEGESVGIIGLNGAGKSTLLRAVAGIIPPHEGTVDIRKRITPLLELGIGFHPELSGRENCILSGTLLGHTPHLMKTLLPGIIDFSGIGSFIESPVKVYSAGMYARLAFALATAVEPEILLVDEILGVGDEFFQRKCMHRMQTLMKEGVTTLIVSHNLDYLVTQCHRLIWIDQGQIALDGDPMAVITRYRSHKGHQHISETARRGDS